MDKVTIIIPVYGVEEQLQRCVQSLQNQSHRNLEIMLVDDGSLDRSSQLCDRFAAQDERIVVIHQPNQWVSAARNHALVCATGDYVMFLDGDDALDPETVETCLRESEGGKWDVIVFGYHQLLDDDGTITLMRDTGHERLEIPDREDLRQNFLRYYKSGIMDFVTDKFYRASVIRESKASFLDLRIGSEDALFMIDLIPYLSSFKVTNYVFYRYYRRSGASITLVFSPNKFRWFQERVSHLYRLMSRFGCVDPEFLILRYGIYFLWTYESMLAKTCKLNIWERLRYIRGNFRMQTIFPEQKKTIQAVLRNKSAFSDFCFGSRVALKLFYRKHLFLLWIWQTITIWRNRGK